MCSLSFGILSWVQPRVANHSTASTARNRIRHLSTAKAMSPVLAGRGLRRYPLGKHTLPVVGQQLAQAVLREAPAQQFRGKPGKLADLIQTFRPLIVIDTVHIRSQAHM